MRTSRLIHVVSCHAGGEVGDVVVGGVPVPPGATIREQARFVAEDDGLRRFLLNEPRGGVFRHVNLLVPAVHPDAATGFIIMEPTDTPLMSGSNAMCVATVLLETGLVPMEEPETRLILEAPGGLVEVVAACRAGKAERVAVRNVPAFVDRLDAPLEIEGLGTLSVDTAFGGDSFVVVDARALGLSLVADEARELASLGVQISDAADAQLGFSHPTNGWDHVSFCLFVTEASMEDGVHTARHAVAIRPGKIDRSPTGTAVCARMALLHARGRMDVGGRYAATSIIGSRFEGRIDSVTRVGERPGVIPVVEGSAWMTGVHQHMLDPDDPWPSGYRLADTWPRSIAQPPTVRSRLPSAGPRETRDRERGEIDERGRAADDPLGDGTADAGGVLEAVPRAAGDDVDAR